MGLISRVSSRTYRKTMGDPSSMNGGAVVAMTGHECVAIASDLRFGMDLKTIGVEFEKVFQMGDNLFMGLGGFITDIQTVKEKVLFRKNLYEQREGRRMTPKVFENMLSNMLYEHRFGQYFVTTGPASDQLMGICEALWQPKMSPDDLFECVSQSILNAVDRDGKSGWGAVVYIIEKEKVTKRILKGRMD